MNHHSSKSCTFVTNITQNDTYATWRVDTNRGNESSHSTEGNRRRRFLTSGSRFISYFYMLKRGKNLYLLTKDNQVPNLT